MVVRQKPRKQYLNPKFRKTAKRKPFASCRFGLFPAIRSRSGPRFLVPQLGGTEAEPSRKFGSKPVRCSFGGLVIGYAVEKRLNLRGKLGPHEHFTELYKNAIRRLYSLPKTH